MADVLTALNPYNLCKVMHMAQSPRGVRRVELYINSSWTERHGMAYIAEAIAWSENGNHVTLYATGITAEEADAKLICALDELGLVSETIVKDE